MVKNCCGLDSRIKEDSVLVCNMKIGVVFSDLVLNGAGRSIDS